MISLISTVLNERNNIEQWINGILSQSALPDEIIIVDGGSRDGTWEWLLEQGSKNPKIKVFQESGNISHGRNFAIKQAQGEVIVATDAGCIYDQDWFKNITAPFLNNKSVVVATAFGPWLERDDSFLIYLLAAATTPAPVEFKKDWLPSSRSVAFLKSNWERVGGYPEWIPICEDIIFDLKLKKAGVGFDYIREPLVFWQPRKTLKAYFRQLFRYTKSDGHGKLWPRRQFIRYFIYSVSLLLLYLSLIDALFLGALLLGLVVYMKKFWIRWFEFSRNLGIIKISVGFILVPLVIASGDIAKMAGWPVGVYERWTGKIKFENY